MILRALAALILYLPYVAWVALIAVFFGDFRGRLKRMTQQLWWVVRDGK